jgi:hypothetical protein
MMDQQILDILHEIKGDLVTIQTELLLMKFALEKIEKQVEELHESRQQPQDPFGSMSNMQVERL